MAKQNNDKAYLFEQAPIPKAVMSLCLPTILTSLVMVVYSLADTYFVGMLNDPIQSAAVSVASPALLAFNAINNLFGVGTSSAMSRALGRGAEIRRIARHEECVFVGRCADFVLHDQDVKLLTVFVAAPDEHRIRRKMEQEKLSRDQAVRLIRKMDKQRRKYYENYTGRTWGAPDGYDLYLNTGSLSTDEAAACIAARFREMA